VSVAIFALTGPVTGSEVQFMPSTRGAVRVGTGLELRIVATAQLEPSMSVLGFSFAGYLLVGPVGIMADVGTE
jgi:hypothetical protein